MSKSKIAIAMLLMFSMVVTLVAIPVAIAHDPPWTIPTYAYVNAAPDPVGVGQSVALTGWIDKVPPGSVGFWGVRWHNMKFTITKPDGHTEELGPFNSDPVGGAWTSFVPDDPGIYEIVFSFPGQVAYEENPYPYGPVRGADFYNDTYLESTSDTYYLVVQEDQIATAYPDTPLPTEYWSRPINSMNREWYSIGGNWLGLASTSFGLTGMYSNTGNFNPYTTAPNSAHVVWTEPLAFGGQIGGEFGPNEQELYATGTAYETKFGAVILYGILYYTEYPGAMNNPTGLKAVDLRTGETVWEKPITTPLKCGMIYNFITGDQYGGHAYLFTEPGRQGFIIDPTSNDWEMYDAMTGEWILNIDNATSGTLVRGENGEILSYRASGGKLTMWNASKCIEQGSFGQIYQVYSPAEIWRPPQGATIDWSPGNEWSVPIPNNISGVPLSGSLGITQISDDVVLMTQMDTSTPGSFQTGYRIDAGLSAIDGRLLWGPINRTLTPFTGISMRSSGDGVYVEYNRNKKSWTGYSLENGQKLWGPTEPANSSWAYYDYTGPSVIGYGNLYTWGLAGEVYCYDALTGEEKWSYNTGASGVDSPFGSWPLGTWQTHHVLADGKLYVRAGHDYTPPVFKGAKLYCLNATTGEEIWSSLSFDIVGSPACADGYMVWYNGYDNQIYCYSKGPSTITVSAPDTTQSFGTAIQVKGMVTDESPGAKEYAQTARFPHGVPAISDEDMSAWMEYLYQQQPKPTDAKGVEITIAVLDPNNNLYDVATAESDVNGYYSALFTPLVPGEYTIYATFPGSESYYASVAETFINVEEAPAATAEPTPTPSSVADLYFLPMSIGTIVAIVVIGLLLFLVIRKR